MLKLHLLFATGAWLEWGRKRHPLPRASTHPPTHCTHPPVVFALSVCGSYRTPTAQLWRPPLYLAMYLALAALAATLVELLLLPIPAGEGRGAGVCLQLSLYVVNE